MSDLPVGEIGAFEMSIGLNNFRPETSTVCLEDPISHFLRELIRKCQNQGGDSEGVIEVTPFPDDVVTLVPRYGGDHFAIVRFDRVLSPVWVKGVPVPDYPSVKGFLGAIDLRGLLLHGKEQTSGLFMTKRGVPEGELRGRMFYYLWPSVTIMEPRLIPR